MSSEVPQQHPTSASGLPPNDNGNVNANANGNANGNGNGNETVTQQAPAQQSSSSSSSSSFLETALARNHSWASNLDPNLLQALSVGQAPSLLWIGCSDSRVPAEQLLDLPPGSIFVHRNIANILHTSDPSSQAVIDYAVNHLKVKHVVVCGHIGCGGVAGAMTAPGPGLSDSLNLWLNPAREVRMECNRAVKGFGDMQPARKMEIVVEGNVGRSLDVLRRNPSVVRSMVEGRLELHGLVYDVGTGRLREVGLPKESAEERRTRELCFGMTK